MIGLGEQVLVGVDVRHQVDAALLEQADAFVVDQAAMLDRGDAGARRALDALGAVGMGGDLLVPHGGLGDQGVELLLGVLRRADLGLLGEHAAGRHDLDPIGAVLDLEAHQLADLGDAVGDAREVLETQVGREPGQVVVAAGRPHRQRRHQHARADHLAAVDGIAQGDVDELAGADVAHRGEARLEGAPRVDVGDHREVDRAAPEEVLVVVAALVRDGSR